MKIMSWNVNGLVACKRKGFLKVLALSRACLLYTSDAADE